MRSSSTSRRARCAAGILLLAAAGAGPFPPLHAQDVPPPGAGPSSAQAGHAPIAVFPLDNLSGHPMELIPLRDELKADLEARGLAVLDDATLETFLVAHRIRWTGGLSREASEALAAETGARSALVTTVTAEDQAVPPRIAITTRLVAAGGEPRIAWMESEAEAGDDAPGFLSLGLVEDPAVLQERTIDRLAGLLAARLGVAEGGHRTSEGPGPARGRYRPQRWYRSPHVELSSAAPARVAVLPFRDESRRRGAGDIVPLLLVRHFASSPVIDVLEPGVVRETLLQNRVIMEGGVSLAQVEVLRSFLQADYVVTGTVTEFGEFPGRNGSPRVEFTVRVIDARTNQAVWSSISFNEGEDGVFFFGCGRIRSASALASEMARQVVAGFTGPK